MRPYADEPDCSGGDDSLISSRPFLQRADRLPELDADVHSDELLVPDENDEPSEMIELGRRVDFTSGSVPEKELRNFGAV